MIIKLPKEFVNAQKILRIINRCTYSLNRLLIADGVDADDRIRLKEIKLALEVIETKYDNKITLQKP